MSTADPVRDISYLQIFICGNLLTVGSEKHGRYRWHPKQIKKAIEQQVNVSS